MAGADVLACRFDPVKSKTIRYIKHGQFFLQYADNSNLKGYEATDIVQFGDFYTFTKFGGITVCNRSAPLPSLAPPFPALTARFVVTALTSSV